MHVRKDLAIGVLFLACLGGMLRLAAQTPAANSSFVLSDQESEVYYNFAVAAGGQIQVEEGTDLAGNLHSNDKIDLKPGSLVTGDVSAVGEIITDGTVSGSVQPGAEPLILPTLADPEDLRQLAERVLSGDQVLSDEVVDDIVFVAGKVEVFGSLDGVGTIIATAEINLMDANVALDPGTRLSLISYKHIEVGKGRSVRAALRAQESVIVEEDSSVEGVIVADQEVILKKNSTVDFLSFDQVPPEVALVSPADASFVPTATPRIVVEYSDDFSGLRLESLELLLDGVDRVADATVGEEGLSFTPEPLAEGLHTLEVAISDHSANETRVSFSFTVDLTPPALAIIEPSAPIIYNASTPAIRAEYSDGISGVDLATLSVTIDGVDLTAGCAVGPAAADCEAPELAEGAHTVSAQARDLAGNAASFSFEFELIFDLEPPVIAITSPADGSVVGVPSVEVSGTVTDENPIAGVTVNGLPAVLAGDSFSAAVALVSGPNSITVEASDIVGNAASTAITVTFGGGDTTPPTLAILSPTPGIFLGNSQPDVELTYDDEDSGVDLASLAFTANGAPLAMVCNLAASSGDCTPAGPLPEGLVDLVASLSDLDGNSASAAVEFTVDTVGVEIEIVDPADGLITAAELLDVIGTAGPGVATVEVNGVAASLTGGSFSATLSLREGTHMIVALATKTNGNTGADSIEVTRDIFAPVVRIDSPRDGFVAVSPTLPVTGLVNDIVNGSTNARVLVNGVEALVANGAFMLSELELVPGPNTIEAVATDAVGNEGRHSINVLFQPPIGARIGIAEGNGQNGVVNQQLSQPLIALVTDDLGNPVAGRVISFEVTRNSGTLRLGATDAPARLVQVPTDGAGRAAALFTLGDIAGEGNNRVRATGLGVAGEVEFCASALAAAPDKILMVSGDNQRGQVGQPLPMPLEALVVDGDGNPIPGIDVTFAVTRGDGTLDGAAMLVRPTGLDGQARVVLTLGPEEGINNNGVAASFAGMVSLPATFNSSGLLAGDPAQTRLSGVVLDNGHTPIPGAAVSIAGTALETLTDAEGQFRLIGVPVGQVELDIDPSGSPRPETFPPLAFETVTVAGQDNDIGQPILIPALDTGNSRIVGGPEDVTLTMEDVEGLSLTVFANSVTFPDGSRTGQLTISQVHLDKVPMSPPIGTTFMPPAWTIQPAGVAFDPPARITIPNDGLPPGRLIDIFQFDHSLNDFINVGRGTVSDDGFDITSDPGFGITRAGWGGCGNPPPPNNCGDGCEDGNVCNGVMACVDGECVQVQPPLECEEDDDPCTQIRCDPKKGCVSDPGDEYSPDFWNDGGPTQGDNNCYAYAGNQPTGTFAQPGRDSGLPPPRDCGDITCASVSAGAQADGFSPQDCSQPCPPGERKIALVVAPHPVRCDYHWYREDMDGTWSHKPGGAPATQSDAGGNPITDPEMADRDYPGGPNYSDFCGCFCVSCDENIR